MSFSASLDALHATAESARVGEGPAARLADVQALLAREMREIEALIATHIEAGVRPATEAARHLASAGGKRVRPMALLLSAACFQQELSPRVRELAAASEIVHMATLLHDDVIDDADKRRGLPTSRRVWGNAVSVLAGDLLLVEALRLASNAHPDTVRELIATLGRLVDGEVIQLRGRAAISLDEATYFEVVRGKTASLFEWALRAGAREASAPSHAIEALGAFGAHLGVAFQLVDDVLDYDGDADVTGKSLLGDLLEGKVTLPLLRAAAVDAEIAPLVARVRAGEQDAAFDLGAKVRASGACDVVRELARETTHAALAALESIPVCRAREVLSDVARGLTARVS